MEKTNILLGEEEYNVQQLNEIKETIENMSIYHQQCILKILYDSNVILNENKNGNYVNLTEIKPEILNKLSTYIHYVKTQEDIINSTENKKKEYKALLGNKI